MKVGITGHQRLEPADSWQWVQQELRHIILEESSVPIEAYSSLAIGADQRFALVAIEHGANLHVIVPCSEYEGTFNTQEDLGLYRYLLSKATIIDLLDYPMPSEDAFMAAAEKTAKKTATRKRPRRVAGLCYHNPATLCGLRLCG